MQSLTLQTCGVILMKFNMNLFQASLQYLLRLIYYVKYEGIRVNRTHKNIEFLKINEQQYDSYLDKMSPQWLRSWQSRGTLSTFLYVLSD